jgi:hypothetical protein
VSVVRNYASGEAPVYNLTVADQPEFFANGILTHNCVWALTSLMIGEQPGEIEINPPTLADAMSRLMAVR